MSPPPAFTHVSIASISADVNDQYPVPSSPETPSTSHWMMRTSYRPRNAASSVGRVVYMSTLALLCELSQSVNAVVLSIPPWKPVWPGRPIEAMLKHVQRPASSQRCARGALPSSGVPASVVEGPMAGPPVSSPLAPAPRGRRASAD